MAIVKWKASPAGDVVADALIALIMHAQSSAASIRLSSKPCRHGRSFDASEDNITESKKARLDKTMTLTEDRLRLINETLEEQFGKVEAVYEGNTASYEIKTDTGLESGIVEENEELTCTVNVSFPDDNGGIAEIRVECLDKQLASNVQDCLRNLTRFTAPLR